MDAEHFWARAEPDLNTGCWLWTGAATKDDGYGQFGKPVVLAHRYAWVLAYGPIPEGDGHHGTCVLHRCDTPRCINPAHLFLGTQGENVEDMVSKGRCRRAPGEANRHAVLTREDVLAIRASGLPQAELAAIYGVQPPAISRILSRQRWKHI